MAAERRSAAVAPAALVTHVRPVAAVRPHVDAELIRHEEELGAHRTLVARLRADPVLPHVPPQLLLPKKLGVADGALEAQLLRVDAHVHAQVGHGAVAAAALGAHKLPLSAVDLGVDAQRLGSRVAAAAVHTLVQATTTLLVKHIGNRFPQRQLRSNLGCLQFLSRQ